MTISAREAPNELLSGLWKKVIEQGHVYAIILRESILFVQDPETIAQEQYLVGDQQESCLVLFLDEKGCEAYRETISEIFEDIRPSELTMGKFSLQDIFNMNEELQTMSLNDFSCPMRIDVCTMMNDDEVLADVLYSSFRTKH